MLLRNGMPLETEFASCNRFFERISINDVLEDKNFIGYLGDAVSLTLSIMDSFRGLHILFDNKDEKQHQMYDLFEKDTFNKLGYKAKINTHTTSYIN